MYVGESVLAGIDFTFTGAGDHFNSGIEMETEGDLTATEERTESVTFTTQSAVSFGLAIGVWPTLEISSPDSSMKIWLFSDTRSGCETGDEAALADSGRMIA